MVGIEGVGHNFERYHQQYCIVVVVVVVVVAVVVVVVVVVIVAVAVVVLVVVNIPKEVILLEPLIKNGVLEKRLS